MLNAVELKNFGPIESFRWDGLGGINLLLGANGAGKTFLLKAIYCAVRALEEKRGNEPRDLSRILFDKIYWTFQPDKIGDLVSKGAEEPRLSFRAEFEGGEAFSFAFGKDAAKEISQVENSVPLRSDDNSVFLPAKEVLSLHQVILNSRDVDRVFGFDDAYLDLARALRQPPTKGKNHASFAEARQRLEGIIGGKVHYDFPSNQWIYKNSKNQKFHIGVTAEGVKKIGILDTLLGNRYLSPGSIVFIDEPESALHPSAISGFLDILAPLAEDGVQFFMASHSYFVVKKLFLIAQEKKMSIPVVSYEGGEWRPSNLRDEAPDNAIIDESIELYKKEIAQALQ